MNDASGERKHPTLSRTQIERQFLANSGLIIAARIITAALAFVTVPVLVSRFGVAGYGTWEALFALSSLASIFQAGVAGTVVWRVSHAFSQGDTDEIRRVARLGAGATWVVLALLWPVAWFLRGPIIQFLRVPPELQQVATDMLPFVVALVLLGGLCETLEGVVSGCQRTGLVNVIGAGAQILNYSVVILLTLFGAGLWSLVVGQAVGFVSRLAGAGAVAWSLSGPVSIVPLLPRRDDLAMARYSGLLTVSSVAAVLRDQTDKVILASLASPSWVGYYGMAARLAALVMEILRPLYSPLLTAAGALNANGDWAGVARLYSRSMTMVSVLTGLVLVLVAGLADYLVILWIGYPIPEVTWLLWLLITGRAAAAVLTGPGTAICRGSGRAGIETTYLAVNLVLNVVLTVWLVLWIGPAGTAVATGASWALASLLFIVLLHRRLDLPTDASRRAGALALLAAGVAVAVYWTSTALGSPADRDQALWLVVLLGTAGGLVYAGLTFLFRLISVRDLSSGWRLLRGRPS